MLKIRLMRIGTKKKPFYRVVVMKERSKRTGDYIELLGTYNPLTEPKEIKLIQDRIDYWIKQGAQPSTGYLRIIGKAPQRPPRKPKKAKAEEPKADKTAPAAPEEQKDFEETPETTPSSFNPPAPSDTSEKPDKPKSGEGEKKDERPA